MKHDTQLVTRIPINPTTQGHFALQGFASQPFQDDISFGELFHVLRKRKWIIVGCIALTMSLALAASLYMTPKYQASSKIEINKENSDALGLDEMGSMMGG